LLEENGKYISNLISSAKEGNFKIYIQIISLYMPNIYGFVFRIVYSVNEANAITKEVFDFAWRNISQVRMNSSLLEWFHGISLNLIMTKYRQDNLMGDEEEATLNLSPFDKALKILTFEERLLLMLHDFKKYNFSEIHDMFPEMSIDETQKTIYESRKKMSEALRK
jgi:DNA-directed RNA polymerase specialized sigma24 family protein